MFRTSFLVARHLAIHWGYKKVQRAKIDPALDHRERKSGKHIAPEIGLMRQGLKTIGCERWGEGRKEKKTPRGWAEAR